MKHLAILFVCLAAFIMVLPSCNGDKLKKEQETNMELTDSLQNALAEQDSLMSILNEITDGMTQIRDLEKLMSSGNLGESPASKKEQIKSDMMLIQQALQERRQKLDAMEAQLKRSGSLNGKLQKQIESMKAQISDQEKTIGTLQDELKNANIKIEGLTNQVSALNTTVETVSQEKKAAQEEAIRVANELNTCYYVVGSKGELKSKNIIQSGFLRKTKIMEGDYELSYFTKADKRTLNEIPLHSKKAKILTKQPTDSYQILDYNGVKVLKITNPTKFWELSNFLIVQID